MANEQLEEDFSEPIDEQVQEEVSFTSFSDALNTHVYANKTLLGNIISLEKHNAKISLQTTNQMSIDELGLIHSGFIGASAEYCASISINETNTVIIGSKVSFLAPAKLGDIIEFEGHVRFEDARKKEVDVVGKINDIKVFQGIFYAVVLEKHIFKTKIKNVKRSY